MRNPFHMDFKNCINWESLLAACTETFNNVQTCPHSYFKLLHSPINSNIFSSYFTHLPLLVFAFFFVQEFFFLICLKRARVCVRSHATNLVKQVELAKCHLPTCHTFTCLQMPHATHLS